MAGGCTADRATAATCASKAAAAAVERIGGTPGGTCVPDSTDGEEHCKNTSHPRTALQSRAALFGPEAQQADKIQIILIALLELAHSHGEPGCTDVNISRTTVKI